MHFTAGYNNVYKSTSLLLSGLIVVFLGSGLAGYDGLVSRLLIVHNDILLKRKSVAQTEYVSIYGLA